MARQHSETAAAITPRRPQVPDRRFIATQAAGEALDGILAAGWYDKRFGDLSLASASMLGAVLRFCANEGKPPSIAESAAITALSEHDAEQHVADLQRHDLLIRNRDDGAIAGACPSYGRSGIVYGCKSLSALPSWPVLLLPLSNRYAEIPSTGTET